MIRPLVLLLLAVCMLTSCVPNKKLVFLQHDDLRKRKEIPKDSVLRSHTMQIQEYRIQPLDIWSGQFESITAEEFDFFCSSARNIRVSGGNISSIESLMGICV